MRRVSLSLAFLLISAGTALAQTVSSTTGAIDGKVTDTSDGVLPGVTVSIASPAMMGIRDTVTSDTGTFRFVSLTPGVYEVTFVLPGFAQMKRSDVRVGAGFTATLNITMQVAGLEESVTVSGASPVVDTQATRVQTTFDSAKLAQLPLGTNDPHSLLAETPAVKMSRVDVGGSAAGTQVSFTAYGTAGQRHYYEGINATTGFGGAGSSGNYPDMYAYDEVAVNTVGNNAEMGPPGVMLVFVVKSGGNAYHGAAGFNYTHNSWQSYNIDDDQIARGIVGGGGLRPQDTNRLHVFRDEFVQLGGYIKKDKLWWFGSFRDTENQIRQTNFPAKPFKTGLRLYQGKGTYQLTQNNKFIGYYMWNAKDQPNRLDRYLFNATSSIHPDDRSQNHQSYTPRVSKIEFNSVVSDAMFFEIRAGQWGYTWTDTNFPGTPSREDLGTRIVSGTGPNQYLKPRRNQVLGSLSYFKQGWGGSHNFKVGWEIFRETVTQGYVVESYNSVVHVLRNGVPLEVYLLGQPTLNVRGMWSNGSYFTDSWRVSNALTLNLGLRFDRHHVFLPAQRHEADRFFPETVEFPAVKSQQVGNLFAPRVGISYNLTGDGQTVLKANWGLFWSNPSPSANANGTWRKQHVWTDRNGDLEWQPGEEGRLISSSGGTLSTSLDPNQKYPYTYDMSVWLERELIPNLGMRAGFVHRENDKQAQATINTNQPYDAFTIPTTVRDPGPDGRAGTADDGGLIPAFNLAAAYVGLPTRSFVSNWGNDSKYDTIELSMTKRMSNRWMAATAFSHTWAWAGRTGLNPNGCINANADCQDETTDYSFKLNGSFELPAGIKLSPVYRFQSGNNFARTFVASLNYANPTINAEPSNARRTKHVNLLDLRVDRSFTIKGGRLSPYLDLYNVTNSNAEQDLTVSSGANWLRPINIIPPRVARIGARFDW